MTPAGQSVTTDGVVTVWEQRLRELDGEVAAGRITAEEFRRRRGELLAGAGQGAQGNDPFPPPFRWATRPADATQVIGVTGPPVSADATQVVRSGRGRAADETQVVDTRRGVPSVDPERTQLVRPPAPSRQSAPPPRSTAPPWLVDGAPSSATPQGWTPDGPDFSGAGAPRIGRTVLVVGLVVVLVVAVIVGAVVHLT